MTTATTFTIAPITLTDEIGQEMGWPEVLQEEYSGATLDEAVMAFIVALIEASEAINGEEDDDASGWEIETCRMTAGYGMALLDGYRERLILTFSIED